MDYDPVTDTFKALGDFGGGGPYYYTFDAGYQDTAHSRIILHGHGVPDAEYCSRDIDGQTCSCPVADKYVIMKRAADGHFYYVSEMVRPREPTYLIN